MRIFIFLSYMCNYTSYYYEYNVQSYLALFLWRVDLFWVPSCLVYVTSLSSAEMVMCRLDFTLWRVGTWRVCQVPS